MDRKRSESVEKIMTLTETVHGIVCEVCKKRFSGHVPAQQHLQSIAHKRKVELQAQQSSHHLWCKVCNLQCNSEQQFATHRDSPRHHHMIQQLNIIREQQALTAAQNSSDKLGLSYRENHLSSQQTRSQSISVVQQISPASGSVAPDSSILEERSSAVDSAAEMNVPTDLPPDGIYFNGSRGHCFLCEIELTSLQHKSQHVEGKQHKKRTLALGRPDGVIGTGGNFNSSEGEGVMMCSVCEVPLSGMINVQEHFNSSKHKARLMQNATEVNASATSQTVALTEHGSFSCFQGLNSLSSQHPSFQGQVNQQAAVMSPLWSRNADQKSADSPDSLKVEWLPGRGRGVCQVCDQQFQSTGEFSQHCGSKSHLEREEELKKERCQICSVQYSGLASAKQHLNGVEHKLRVKHAGNVITGNTADPNFNIHRTEDNLPNLSEYRNSLNFLSSSSLSHRMSNVHELEETFKKCVLGDGSSVHQATIASPQVSHNPFNVLHDNSKSAIPMTVINIPPSVVEARDLDGQQQGVPSTLPEYVFDGSRGRCNVCNIELTSKPHAESHLAGAKHKKATQRWNPLPAGNNDTQMQPIDKLQESPSAQHVLANANQDIAVIQNLSRPLQAYRFDGNRGNCFACKIELTSNAHANQHLAGKKHQTAAERWIQEGEACNYPLYCDICHKPFTGQESAAQHFSSEKHKKKVILSEGATTGRKEPTTGALIITLEGQMWYLCEVCKCPLNTLEQFKLHVNSPKHNAEVEKALQQERSSQSSPTDAALMPRATAEITEPVLDLMDFEHLVTKSSVKVTPGARVQPVQPVQQAHMVVGSTGGSGVALSANFIPGMHVKTESGNVSATSTGYSGHGLAQRTGHTGYEDAAQGERFAASNTSTGYSGHGLAQRTGHTGYEDAAQGERFAISNTSTGYSGHGLAQRTGHTGYEDAAQGERFAISNTSTGYSGHGLAQRTGHTGYEDAAQGERFAASNTSAGQFLHSSSLGHHSTTNNTSNPSRSQTHAGHRFGEATLSGLPYGLGVVKNTRINAGNRGSCSAAQVLRPDGKYEYDDEDEARALPTASSTRDYEDQEGESRPVEDRSISSYVSSIHGGSHLSQTAAEKQLAETASSVTDNLTSIHTDAGSLSATVRHAFVNKVSFDMWQQPVESKRFKGFRYFCPLCRQPMNTKEDYERHMNGLKHQMKAATVSAPDMRLSGQNLIKMEDYEVSLKNAYVCCNTMPRTYQVELMCKAMSSDSTVIYLPTGTGKTLAAMMTLSRMLTLNPTRPVLFLVDKVLLVLQQARYIITELGNREFKRPHLIMEDDKLQSRHLKVAVLCGGLSVRDGTPLWKYDVIVTTAAFCQNLLQESVLRWANFSLVVLDEAHHCTKKHPYNKLLSEHHLSLPPNQRPKVLGLTASPAGRRTKEETLIMLKDLLQNLGGATIASLDDKPNAKEQLDAYSSSARLVPVCVPMTEAEMGFHEKLLSYFIHTYVELMHCSNLQQVCSQDLQVLMHRKPPDPDQIKKFAQHLMSEPDELSEMVQLAQTARMRQGTDHSKSQFENIRMHVMAVGMTLLNSEDGIDFVLDDLERLFNPNLNKCFDELMQMGLPCKEIATYIGTLCDSAKLRTREESEREELGMVGAPSSMSIFQELLGTLADHKYMTWDSSESMALVLVRERKVAHKFKDHLKKTTFVREHKMRVAVVVGHGAGGGEGEGMNLRKQDKVLQGIKSHRYNIVVATSVAEEGVDIPECQLVVCLNPPTTVKALVQMRGRARKKDSYFVVLCSSQREKEKLEDLQRQEENMKWAAAQLTETNIAKP